MKDAATLSCKDLDFVRPTASRPLHPTMGQGVAERTYLRRVFTDEQRKKLGGFGIMLNKQDPNWKKWYVAAVNSDFEVIFSEDYPISTAEPETRWETWHDVAHRVAVGNVSLLDFADNNSDFCEMNSLREAHAKAEYKTLSTAIANGSLLMSGRHLQQGDIHQTKRPMEVFTNCATAATSFALFQLLLNGSGVGRDYSDKMMVVDWAQDLPMIVPVLDETHPDFVWGKHISTREAQHLYKTSKDVRWHKVGDSREGWGRAVEDVEMTTYRNGRHRVYQNDNPIRVLILEFSDVRGEGTPIMGMQGRPSSGPAPMMDAMDKISRIRNSGIKPWLATLYIDHYLAEPVLVGGARRSARMSTKDWRDEDILEFVGVKRPIEYGGMTREQVELYRADRIANGEMLPMSFLWSSNNSVAVDKDFWDRVHGPITADPLTQKAKMVFEYVSQCAYGDGTGEPGFINVDKLTADYTDQWTPEYEEGRYMGSLRYAVTGSTRDLLMDLFDRFKGMPYHYITNPCGEIALSILGGFCVIADVVPFHSETLEEVEDVVRASVRALMRVNLMDSLYNVEVKRTNRIGVGLTGIHEAAWKFFNIGFRDMVNPDFTRYQNAVSEPLPTDARYSSNPRVRAAAFWEWMGSLARAADHESRKYAKQLGVSVPHTVMTIKPSGSVSKLFGLSEGWHLPAMRHYLRWVQYHSKSPMIEEYRAMGYPVRELKTYRDHFIVGFPTEPAMCALEGVDEHLVTAAEASMEDQFAWLMLGEFFYMEGGSVDEYIQTGGSLEKLLLIHDRSIGNQISYTMKYKVSETPLHLFKDMLRQYQPHVRCCSVMPQEDGASYEYLPEEQVSVVKYQAILSEIRRGDDTPSEDVGLEHLDCSTGACPIVFDNAVKEAL